MAGETNVASTPPTQDEAWLKALPRRVGRMGYAQVRALFDENRQRLKAHVEPCLECEGHMEYRYQPCETLDAIQAERGRPGGSAISVAHAMTRHRKDCPTCQTVLTEWFWVERCAHTNRLHRIEQIYSNRLAHLALLARKGEAHS